jgi:hypothetical protein
MKTSKSPMGRGIGNELQPYHVKRPEAPSKQAKLAKAKGPGALCAVPNCLCYARTCPSERSEERWKKTPNASEGATFPGWIEVDRGIWIGCGLTLGFHSMWWTESRTVGCALSV